MTGWYVTWSASGLAYVEADSAGDAIDEFESHPGTYATIDFAVGEYAASAGD